MKIVAFEPPPSSKSSRPGPPVRLTVTAEIVAETTRLLRAGSAGQVESLVLWAGTCPPGDPGRVTHAIVPEIIAERLRLTVPLPERIEVAGFLRRNRLLAFTDLHTHEDEAFLSPLDRSRPFSARDGFYALVVPNFATGSPALGWRAYEARHGKWQEVAPRDRFPGWPIG